MTEPKRPWRGWKRWTVAVLLWLLVAYPASVGPISYAQARGRCPGRVFNAAKWFYAPITAACGRWPTVAAVAQGYEGWWWKLGKARAASY